MTNPYEPQEIPQVGSERELIRAFLDFYRDALRFNAHGITEAQARTSVAASDLTLIGLVRHLAFVERYWFPSVFAGGDPAPLFDDSVDKDRDFHAAADETLAEAFAMLDAEIISSRTIEDAAESLDVIAAKPRHGQPVSLRWIMIHMIEEYACHVGHAELIREAINKAA
jgi:uncharacterized damage-inducible protein DinB